MSCRLCENVGCHFGLWVGHLGGDLNFPLFSLWPCAIVGKVVCLAPSPNVLPFVRVRNGIVMAVDRLDFGPNKKHHNCFFPKCTCTGKIKAVKLLFTANDANLRFAENCEWGLLPVALSPFPYNFSWVSTKNKNKAYI